MTVYLMSHAVAAADGDLEARIAGNLCLSPSVYLDHSVYSMSIAVKHLAMVTQLLRI